jgi:hypothetical protein
MQELLRRAEELRAEFARARDATARLGDAFAAGLRPDGADLSCLSSAVEAFDTVSSDLSRVMQGEYTPTNSLDELDTKLLQALNDTAETALCARFTAVSGPTELEESLELVRAAASKRERIEHLQLLADLSDAVAEGPYTEAATGLLSRALTGLPTAWQPIAMAIAQGNLATDSANHEPAPGHERVRSEESESGAGSVEDPKQESNTGPRTSALSPESLRSVEAVPRTPAPTEGGEGEPRNVSSGTDSMESGLRSLEALDERIARESAVRSLPGTEDEAGVETVRRHGTPSSPASGEADRHSPRSTTHGELVPADRKQDDLTAVGTGEQVVPTGVNSTGEHIPASASEESGTTSPTEDQPAEAIDEEPSPAAPAPSAPPVKATATDSHVPRLDTEAVRRGRLALSGWLHRSAGSPDNVARARFAAALAHEVIETGGDLSDRFRAQALALADDLPDGRDERVLVWAAALRAGLVSPSFESYHLLERASGAVNGCPALTALSEAFAEAAQRGVRLNAAENRQHLRDTGMQRRRREEAVRRAREDSDHASRRKINYQGATEVWRVMVSHGGDLRPLIDIPAQDDGARLEELERFDVFDPERLVDEVHARIGKRVRSPRKRIEARARQALLRYIEELRTNARDWANTVYHTENLEQAEENGLWGLDGLNRLSSTIGEHLTRALIELDGLGQNNATAALTAARQLLEGVNQLLEGEPPVSSLLSGDLMLVRDLLLVPSCRVTPDGACERLPSPETLERVLTEPADWERAFEQRVELADLAGAELLVKAARTEDPALADELAGRIESRVEKEQASLTSNVRSFQSTVALHRLYGSLSEDEANRLHDRANGLVSDPTRLDFDVLGDRLRLLAEEADRLREECVHRQREEVERQAGENPDVARYSERLNSFLDNGRITTCDELLSRLRKGEPVPEENNGPDHFANFFPRYPQVLESTRQPRERHHPVTSELRALFRTEGTAPEKAIPTREHRELLAPQLAEQRTGTDRATAYEALRQWNTLSQGPQSSGNRRTAVNGILALLGVGGELDPEESGAKAERRGQRDFVHMDLTGVTPSGEALLPDFGSRMSPSGARLRLQLVWGQPSPLEFGEWLRTNTAEDQTVLVLYFGLLSESQRTELAEQARTRSGPVTAVVDEAVIAYLAALARPEWSTTVRLTAPFTVSKPFQSERMIPEEMFYGRREALEAVMARSGAHFVYGGRQLGKSVLLAEADRRLKRDNGRTHVITRDIRSVSQATEVWQILASFLEEKGICRQGQLSPATKESVCSAIRSWSRDNPDRRLMVFLDEADAFLTIDADEHDFANVVALRDLMNTTDSRFKVVFAGLHNTSRFRSLPNQPFANLGEPVSIGPLLSPDAFDLLVRPLRTLGFVLPDELAVSIIALANNAPALVQYFGQELLRRLRSSRLPSLPYTVTADDVDAVQTGQGMTTAFRQRFDWTLDLDLRYKVIAYAVALHTIDDREQVVRQRFLLDECRTWWPNGFEDCALDEFTSLVEECVDLGVLAAADGENGYRLRTPHILTLLGGYQRVERELENAQENYEKPGVFDSASYRRTHGGGPGLSPLTAGQTALLSRHDDRTRLVIGSRATQVDLVPAALQQVKDELGAHVWEVHRQGLTLNGAFQRCLENGKNIVLVHLSGSVAGAVRQLREADELRRACPYRVNVIAVVQPALTGVIGAAMGYPFEGGEDPTLDRVELVELRRFGPSGLRQWRLLDHFSRLVDESVQTRLLQVTGGWPYLVNKVIGQVVGHDREPAQVLDETERRLAGSDGASFLTYTGLGDAPELVQAWRQISEYGTPEEAKELAELIGMAVDNDPENNSELARVAARGPLALLGIVEVLRGLGALVPVASERNPKQILLRPEPVLDAVFRRVGPMHGEGM